MKVETEQERELQGSGMPFFKAAEKAHARDVKCLTSLRFFAAAWVLVLHFSLELPYAVDEVTSFFANGRLGVDFFFILSGFILTHVYLDSLKSGRFGFLRFVQKRLARLYPLHIVCILLVAGYLVAGAIMGVYVNNPEVYSFERLWPNVLLLHAWGMLDGMSWNYVSWSISAEWFAYLLFLPLSMLFSHWRINALVKLLAALLFLFALMAVAPALLGRDLTLLTLDFGILRILPEFTLGIALYHASLDHDVDPVRGPWMLGMAVVALALVAHHDLGGMLAVPLLAFIIFASASLERQEKLGFLGHRVLVYLGETSYSLYMLHAIVFIVYFRGLGLVLGKHLDEWIWVAGLPVLPLALIAASMGYHWVEVPCRRWMTEKVDLEAMFRLRSSGPREAR